MLAKIALISKLFYKLEKVVMYSSSVHCTVYRIFDWHTLKNLIWKTLDYQKKRRLIMPNSSQILQHWKRTVYIRSTVLFYYQYNQNMLRVISFTFLPARQFPIKKLFCYTPEQLGRRRAKIGRLPSRRRWTDVRGTDGDCRTARCTTYVDTNPYWRTPLRHLWF